MYATILVPTDGSHGAELAAEHAVTHARQNGATLHVLHVVDAASLPLDGHASNLLTLFEEAGREAVELLADRARRDGVEEVVEAVERGSAHRAIADYAREHGVDLVVMGTHGRTGLDRVLLGSVSERVARTGQTPVLVVPTADTEAADVEGERAGESRVA